MQFTELNCFQKSVLFYPFFVIDKYIMCLFFFFSCLYPEIIIQSDSCRTLTLVIVRFILFGKRWKYQTISTNNKDLTIFSVKHDVRKPMLASYTQVVLLFSQKVIFEQAVMYRRLSLSQSPGDQTKYFELSVVSDSQFVTPFTLYMYTDCLYHPLVTTTCMYMYLETAYSSLNTLWLGCSFVNFETAAAEIKERWWLLTSKNAVKQCSITKVTKAPLRTLWV